MTSFNDFYSAKNDTRVKRFEEFKRKNQAITCTSMNPYNWSNVGKSCLQSPLSFQFGESTSASPGPANAANAANAPPSSKFQDGRITISVPYLHMVRTEWIAASYYCGMHPQIQGYQDPRMVNRVQGAITSSETKEGSGIITPIFEEMSFFYKTVMSQLDCAWAAPIDDCGYTLHHVSICTNPSGNKDEMLGIAMGDYAHKRMFDSSSDIQSGASNGNLNASAKQKIRSQSTYPKRYHYEITEQCNVPVPENTATSQALESVVSIQWVQRELRHRKTNVDPLVDFRANVLKMHCLDGIISPDTSHLDSVQRRTFYADAYSEHLNPRQMRQHFRPRAFGPSVMEANRRIVRDSNLRQQRAASDRPALPETEKYEFE